jgi:hypothetical protein
VNRLAICDPATNNQDLQARGEAALVWRWLEARLMRARLAFCVLSMLPAIAAAHAADCPAPRILASVELIAQKNGTVLVPVTVAGTPRYFSLGTASPMSTITPALASELGLVREHSGVTMINTAGRDTNRIATAPDFAIGGLKGRNIPFFVEPEPPQEAVGNQGDAAGPSRAGTLGEEFLRGYDVDLDFAAGRMNLISRDHCDGRILFWKSELMTKVPMSVTDDNKIFLEMTLDGHRLDTILSTNTAHTAINRKVAKTVYDVDGDAPGNEPAGRLNDTPLYAHRFGSLAAGGLAVSNPRIVLLPDLVQDDARHLHPLRSNRRLDLREPRLPDLLLGMSTLSQLHLYIAYGERALYISPAARPQ